MIEAGAEEQSAAVAEHMSNAGKVRNATDQVLRVRGELSQVTETSALAVRDTVTRVRGSDVSAREMDAWVHGLSERTGHITGTLGAEKKNNQDIVSIARQVNTRAINAQIEAAHAGDAGRGFSVVADAIDTPSQQTGIAAVQISENVDILAHGILTLAERARDVAAKAAELLNQTWQTDEALSMTWKAPSTKARHRRAGSSRRPGACVAPSSASVPDCSESPTRCARRPETSLRAQADIGLIDTSEAVVQGSAGIGSVGRDARYITFVQWAAHEISRNFDRAVAAGRVSLAALFDQDYTPVPGSDPQQVMTRFTEITDAVPPEILDPAVDVDPSMVF